MFERFTDRARAALAAAIAEAGKEVWRPDPAVGTEHLLIGVAAVGGLAADALAESDIGDDTLRCFLAAYRPAVPCLPPPPDRPSAPFTPRAKKVLELALRESLQMGHNYIGPQHVLLGILREGEGVAVTLLERAGVDPGALRAAVLDLIRRQPPPVQRLEPATKRRAEGAKALAEPDDVVPVFLPVAVVVEFQAWCRRFAVAAGPLADHHPLRLLDRAIADASEDR